MLVCLRCDLLRLCRGCICSQHLGRGGSQACTMVSLPVVCFLSSPGIVPCGQDVFTCHVHKAMHGVKRYSDYVLRSISAHVCVYHHAGISFFSFFFLVIIGQAQSPMRRRRRRAFGLFLSDLLACIDACDNDSLASTALEGVRAASLNSASAERLRFQQIASHCHSVLEVCTLMCSD